MRVTQVGHKPEFLEPVMLSENRGGNNVQNFCDQASSRGAIHRITPSVMNGSTAAQSPPLAHTDSSFHHFETCFQRAGSRAFARGPTIQLLIACAPAPRAQLHASLAKEFAYALVWGTSSKHYPQRCGLTHTLGDEDVVQALARLICH